MTRWSPKHGKSLVCVKWNDAHGSATQIYSEREHEAYPMETYGLLMQDDDKGVSVVSETYWDNLDEKQEFRGHTFIPRGMVISVDVLLTPYVKTARARKTPVMAATEVREVT